jgi:tripartite-type tricarboxylate transporter receptor subunit TctC
MMRLRSLRMLAVALPLVALVAAQVAHAQAYPNRPVRIVVPAAAGGALDVISRILAIKVGEIWNQQLYVENKPGANWIIGMDAVAKSAPDGYTLLFVASSGLTINPYVFNMPIDPLRDLTLVATATHTPFVLLANNDLPAKNLLEFLAHLRANPGKLNHASNSATTILNSELLKARANVDYVDINYRGASQAIIATQGGSTQFCFVDLGSGSPAIQGKTLRALGPHIAKAIRTRAGHSDHCGAGTTRLCDGFYDAAACACQYSQGYRRQDQRGIPTGTTIVGRSAKTERNGTGRIKR